LKIITQTIEYKGFKINVRREDLIHPLISGNKFRKLKYNINQAKKENQTTLLTFGGAFSNHILAVASAGFENNFRTIGIIRGEELAGKILENPTLKKASLLGMQLKFISRDDYRNKTNLEFIENLKKEFGSFYLLPEGGTNDLAIKGCEEILSNSDLEFNYICCCVGTGGTILGLINSSKLSQKILGFPALKSDYISNDISNFAKQNNWNIISDYHFGGYGKVTDELIGFMNDFYKKTLIPLDPIYTAKMVFGVLDLYQRNFFSKEDKVLVIHSGGLQGIEGMNQKLLKQNKKIIKYEIF
jgi:1-aminocyclopropane-1-carboxylate deaminase